jgi:hypothetical protein
MSVVWEFGRVRCQVRKKYNIVITAGSRVSAPFGAGKYAELSCFVQRLNKRIILKKGW